MESMGIRIYGDKVLRRNAEEVDEFDEELSVLLARMVETMIVEEGVGLAAPQVGISKRVAVVNPEPGNPETLIKLINPRIVSVGEDMEKVEEGCLSVPDIRGMVERPIDIEVVFLDEKGLERKLEAKGLVSRIIQHEVDHLDGILFIDRLSFGRKTMIKGKLKQLASRDNAEN